MIKNLLSSTAIFTIRYAIIGLLIIEYSVAQNTVGVISMVEEEVLDGYNLLYPHNQSTVYLIDNCGQIVHEWTDDAFWRPGNSVYLQEDGSIVKTKRGSTPMGYSIWAGGGGGIIEKRSWENELLWQFNLANDSMRLHHDIAIMDNGNILAIVWELKDYNECIWSGRDSSSLASDELWPDCIIEIEPYSGQIVWEWHAWDHLVQDYSETQKNYGEIRDHPELIDINLNTNNGHADWLHFNAVDYNNELDQVLISVPRFNEIWIIDHSTTIEEAKGHDGGRSNSGGDLLFRWGNPRASQKEDNQKLFFSHDAHWIDEFVTDDSPYYGMIALFNNRVGVNYSTVNILKPEFNIDGQRYIFDNNGYFPKEFKETVTHPDSTQLFSNSVSSVQILENENILICSGQQGYVVELNPNRDVVWEYVIPFAIGERVSQGVNLSLGQNLIFRTKRYPKYYGAFENRNLVGNGFIELNSLNPVCDISTATVDRHEPSRVIEVYPNPTEDKFNVRGVQHRSYIHIYNSQGVMIKRIFSPSDTIVQIDLTGFHSGIYFVEVNGFKRRVIKL